MQSLLSVDVAYQIMRDRQRQADRSILAAQARDAAQPRSQGPNAAQVWLADALRRLAVRLDPDIVCDPSCAAIAIAR